MDIGGRRRAEKRGIRHVRLLRNRNSFISLFSSGWKMVPFGRSGLLDHCSVLLSLVLHDLGRFREETERI